MTEEREKGQTTYLREFIAFKQQRLEIFYFLNFYMVRWSTALEKTGIVIVLHIFQVLPLGAFPCGNCITFVVIHRHGDTDQGFRRMSGRLRPCNTMIVRSLRAVLYNMYNKDSTTNCEFWR